MIYHLFSRKVPSCFLRGVHQRLFFQWQQVLWRSSNNSCIMPISFPWPSKFKNAYTYSVSPLREKNHRKFWDRWVHDTGWWFRSLAVRSVHPPAACISTLNPYNEKYASIAPWKAGYFPPCHMLYMLHTSHIDHNRCNMTPFWLVCPCRVNYMVPCTPHTLHFITMPNSEVGQRSLGCIPSHKQRSVYEALIVHC